MHYLKFSNSGSYVDSIKEGGIFRCLPGKDNHKNINKEIMENNYLAELLKDLIIVLGKNSSC